MFGKKKSVYDCGKVLQDCIEYGAVSAERNKEFKDEISQDTKSNSKRRIRVSDGKGENILDVNYFLFKRYWLGIITVAAYRITLNIFNHLLGKNESPVAKKFSQLTFIQNRNGFREGLCLFKTQLKFVEQDLEVINPNDKVAL